MQPDWTQHPDIWRNTVLSQPPGLRVRSVATIATPLYPDRHPLQRLPHAGDGMLHLMQLRAFLTSADEHAQTSVSEHGERHSPRPAGGSDSAEAARRVAQAGRATIRRRIRLREGAVRKVSASVRRTCIPDTYAASGSNREPGRILIPGDRAAGPARPRFERYSCGCGRPMSA
jgi:hypothetical protein